MPQSERTNTVAFTQAIHMVLSDLDDALAAAQGVEFDARQCREFASAAARVSELAGDAGLTGLHDAGRMFGEVLSGIGDLVTPISQDLHRGLLEWPGLIRAYVDAPTNVDASEALVAHLASPAFKIHNFELEAPILRAMLQSSISQEELASLDIRGDDTQFWSHEGSLNERGSNTREGGHVSPTMIEAMDTLRGATHARRANDSGMARDFHDALDTLAVAANDEGWMGLHDACQLLKESLSVLGDWGASINEEQNEVLQRWPTLVGAYLDWPQEESAAQALVDVLRHPALNLHLADSDAEILKFMLVEHPDLLVSKSTQWTIDDVACTALDPPALITPDTTENNADDGEMDDASTANEWSATLGDEELPTLGRDTVWLSDTSVGAHAGGVGRFAMTTPPSQPGTHNLGEGRVPERIEIDLPGEFTPYSHTQAEDGAYADEVADALAEFASMAKLETDRSEEFVTRYSSSLTRFAEACAVDGRMGLHDICLLLNEDLLTRRASGSLSRDDLEVLSAWPGAVLRFPLDNASEHDVNALVEPLVSHGFLDSISAEDWRILNAMFAPFQSNAHGVNDARFTQSVVSSADGDDELIDDTRLDILQSNESVAGAWDGLARAAQLGNMPDSEFLEHYATELALLAKACADGGFLGVHDLCLLLREELIARVQSGTVEEESIAALRAWAGALQQYFMSARREDDVSALVGGLISSGFLSTLGDDDWHILRSMLGAEPEEELHHPEEDTFDALVLATSGIEEDVERDQECASEQVDLTSAETFEQALRQLDSVVQAVDLSEPQFSTRYLHALLALSQSAASTERMGFHDLCLLLHEDLEVRAQSTHLSSAALTALRAWPRAVRKWVYMSETEQDVDALVSDLVSQGFFASLAEEDWSILKGMFGSAEMQDDGFSDGGFDALVLAAGDAQHGDGAIDSDAGVGPSPAEPTAKKECASAPLPKAAQDLIELLVSEFAQIRAEARTSLAADADEQVDAAGEVLISLGRFAGASDAVGLIGLRDVCTHICDNLSAAKENGQPPPASLPLALEEISNYLQDPGGAQPAKALVEVLKDDTWNQPLDQTTADATIAALCAPDFSILDEDVVARPQKATLEDVSLELPDDVDPDLLDGLLQELPAQTAEFSAAVQRLCGNGNNADVETAQRVAHTLKGAGNTVGVRGIATLTHQLEDVLLALHVHDRLPTAALADCLQNAADCLEAMCEAMLGIGSGPNNARDVLQEVLDWANRIDKDGVPHPCQAHLPEGLKEDQAQPRIQPDASVAPNTEQQLPELHNEEPAQAVVPMLRMPAALVDDLLRLVGETIILTGQVHEGLQRGTDHCRSMTVQFELLQRLGLELEQLIDIKNINLSPRATSGGTQFDPLEMEQYGELHTVSRRLVEAATDARELGGAMTKQIEYLDDLLVGQERLNRETQEAVLRTRMVAVKSVLPRLERSVRQTCRLTGKQAELFVRGADTLIDSDVLNEIVDPIMHLLRNAIDHGLEPSEQRVAAEKPAQGKITLSFLREGSNVIVRCCDDGAGLDYAAIRASAVAKGLVKPQHDLDDNEIVRMVLRPHFSTRKTVTQISGRGIGLDAVYARVTELGGSLSVQSPPGEGCTVELRLPVTLISTHALLVRAYGQVFAIADRGVEQILHRDSGELRKVGDEQLYHVNDSAYPVRRLGMLLDSEQATPASEVAQSVLIAQSETGVVSVLVDEVIGSRDVVVKGLGEYLPRMRGVMGATILGDGSVTPVLDLPELLRQPYDEALNEVVPVSVPRSVLPSALVVDDSLSARRSLEQIMQDAGFVVRTARDGMEATSVLETDPPDVLVTDLEMPRMNGMELARHVRGRSHTATMPVIMVTSRSTLKHKEQAKAAGVDVYLTKPFSEDELLSHVEMLRTRE